MKEFLLLQINDALFPVGGYSHSYGLETYIQRDLVRNENTALNYVQTYIKQNLLHGDLLAVKLAWEICKENQILETEANEDRIIEKLHELDQIITASSIPSELRQASEKIASRFLKTLMSLNIEYEHAWFEKYAHIGTEKNKIWKKNYAVAYGVFCASVGLGMEESLVHLLYAQTSALVTNCVKTIPLSQTVGQKILYDCIQQFDYVINKVRSLGIEDYALSLPGADIRSMQHETLYSRLYMS